MFSSFGLQPAAGRLLTENDDKTPGAHPYAVLSYDYWTRRFGRDPNVLGRRFQMGNDLYEIVGVLGPGFTGTETGIGIDIFVPTMMNPYVERSDASWLRPLAVLKPGVAPEAVRSRLQSVVRAFHEERAKGWTSQTKQFLGRFVDQTVVLDAGVRGRLRNAERLSPLADHSRRCWSRMVLLIACANVANLMTAQAAARAREMALRVSIGAGRWRLVQLVLVESAWLGFLAAGIGAIVCVVGGAVCGRDESIRQTILHGSRCRWTGG